MLLPGGYDLDPSTYGSIKGAGMRSAKTLPAVDTFWVACAQSGFHLLTPMLGICKGLQAMNVAAGGTLIQDIPTEYSDAEAAVGHKGTTHSISITEDSNLSRMLETPEADVNSRHHQAVGHLGHGLHVTAVAPDGLIEAAERDGVPSQWGVQFHPENLVAEQPAFRTLFTSLVADGAAYRSAN
jgi:putative glutamine amidotransferase